MTQGTAAKAKRKRPQWLRPSKLATIGIMVIMLGIFLLDILTVLLFNQYEKRYTLVAENFAFAGSGQGSRIHFLNTENSDAILLESDGHFALVDSGWGSDNPNLKARRPGYEAQVLAYLKRVAADADGKVALDFILCTHYHYDHAGGFAFLMADPAVEIRQAYFRSLEAGCGNQYSFESTSWQLEEIHGQLVEAAQQRGIPVVETAPTEPFALGAMQVQFFNTDSCANPKLRGENDNSVITLVNVHGTRTLLTADATNLHGLEDQLAEQIGAVDLLKLCHHGYAMSNSAGFLRALQPKLAIVTNGLGQVYPNVKWNLIMVAHCPYYSTVREGGIIANYAENGEITLTKELY
ncbi:MAG: MBL fold metallo-hydrolase [Oscillospiraceae bacterium]|nr:MBL fold metallo-hydrolase [Oscillospiraceae bacterium]